MFTVFVTLEARPEKIEDLITALRDNASHSRKEAECLKWEWSQHVDDPARFAIYEVYTSQEAFLTHKTSEHFARWAAASGPCVAAKVAGQYHLIDPDPR